MNKFIRFLTIAWFGLLSVNSYAKTVVAIDAGHGGKDPGAIGKKLGIKEKDVTLAIAKELKALLDADPNFNAIMTRKTDIFVQLPERTEIARENRANYLVSIHADSSPRYDNMKGASVWVLSNRRANDEMGLLLEESEKKSELLGGAGRILAHNNERYLNQTVLDLQFSHVQRTGYALGTKVIGRMARITSLAKSQPQHASLSVLRSPDITSVLVETGFLSNPIEEQKLSTATYRKQIAKAIYDGLISYRNQNSNSLDNKTVTEKEPKVKVDNKPDVTQAIKNNEKSAKSTETKVDNPKGKEKTNESKKEDLSRKIQKSNNSYHLVQQDETLYSIARAYNTTAEKLSKLNNIKNNKIVVGKKLKIE
ncbi:N-acetylmuramoyl-L-alanine amidase [Haemophilus parahaemolyticus]|uniref:N-acetylmuramoyl-L-alanine amidase n=1 Tax=Haemophilus parahaemolyticus TaxID=735 RepID=A0A369ZIH6_HAEPH|nr:N-acetylmuramoyl-L-alanine amidase [Haemophilus parahaemolyticus]RDF05919.1 LysM peptidoglycan-binding domain-containing protein [Haemophilus parahaemolyticus]